MVFEVLLANHISLRFILRERRGSLLPCDALYRGCIFSLWAWWLPYRSYRNSNSDMPIGGSVEFLARSPESRSSYVLRDQLWIFLYRTNKCKLGYSDKHHFLRRFYLVSTFWDSSMIRSKERKECDYNLHSLLDINTPAVTILASIISSFLNKAEEFSHVAKFARSFSTFSIRCVSPFYGRCAIRSYLWDPSECWRRCSPPLFRLAVDRRPASSWMESCFLRLAAAGFHSFDARRRNRFVNERSIAHKCISMSDRRDATRFPRVCRSAMRQDALLRVLNAWTKRVYLSQWIIAAPSISWRDQFPVQSVISERSFAQLN